MAVPLATSGHHPQGDQPTNWRAPTQETALTTGIPTRCAWYGGVVTGARTRGVAGMPGRWSSHKAGTPRGRPSQGTAGSIPWTGGHQSKDWQALFFNKKRLNDLTKLLEADVSEVVCGVPSWFGGLVFLRLFMYSWFLSLLVLRFGLVFQRFGGFPSRSRLTAAREVVQLPQELFSITALGRHFKVPLCHCWRAFRALWYGSSEGILKGIWLASRKLFSPSRVPASLSWDSRWKVAS